MKCFRCGENFPEKAKFCPECGSKVQESYEVEQQNQPRKSEDNNQSFDVQSHQYFGQVRSWAVPSNNDSIDRYTQKTIIGKGGFAVVYKAFDTKLNRFVAIKQLQQSLLNDASDIRTLDRFRLEAQVVAALQHPNIVSVFDQGVNENGDYLIMEYLEMGSLEAYIRQHGVMQIEDTIEMAISICRGLQAAHNKNLVHRDVKPANILLAKGDRGFIPKIVDFGLVRSGRESAISQSGYGVGTRHYMSPEQQTDAKNVNHTADVYSFGKTFYFMLTGEQPDTIDPEKIGNPELAKMIFKCCKSNASERYFSFEVIIADLEKFQKEIATRLQTGNQDVSSDGACPVCKFINRDDVLFCAKCGTGLTKKCPECSEENTISRIYCKSCGTKICDFELLADFLKKMEQLEREMAWSSILQENKTVPDQLNLPGEKGSALNKKRLDIVARAGHSQRALAAYRDSIQAAIGSNNWWEALEYLEKYRALNKSSGSSGKLFEMIEAKIWETITGTIGDSYKEKKFQRILDVSNRYLEKLPTGRHFEEIQKIRMDAMIRSVELATESRRYSDAKSLLNQMSAWGYNSDLIRVMNIQIDNRLASSDDLVKKIHQVIASGELETAEAQIGNLEELVPGKSESSTLRNLLEQTRTDAELVFQTAKEAFDGKNFDKAREVIQAVFTKNSRHSGALKMLDELEKSEGKLKRELLDFDRNMAIGHLEAAGHSLMNAAEINPHEPRLSDCLDRFSGHRKEILHEIRKMNDQSLEEARLSMSRLKSLSSHPLIETAAAAYLNTLQVKEKAAKFSSAYGWNGGQPRKSAGCALAVFSVIFSFLLTIIIYSLTGEAKFFSFLVLGTLIWGILLLAAQHYARNMRAMFDSEQLIPLISSYSSLEEKIAGRLSRREDKVAPACDDGSHSKAEKPPTGDYVWVAPGKFLMGSDAHGCTQWEKPVHEVEITRGYWIGRYPVTQREYQSVMGSNPSHFKGESLPVEQVTWQEATTFCKRLSERSGRKHALPTEAQWELAARGGSASKVFRFAGSNNIQRVAWYSDNSDGKSHPVGQKEPNELDIYDLSGNVWEWCGDWYAEYPSEEMIDPSGPPSGTHKVVRGGGWNTSAKHCHSTFRSGNDPNSDSNYLGFRVVMADSS